MPVVGSAQKNDQRRPKYVGKGEELESKYSASFFGYQDHLLVSADVSDAVDTALQARTDVTKIPDNLDQQIGAGTVTAVRNFLENRNIPANWVTANTTYRTLIKTIVSMFNFVQRIPAVTGIKGKLLTGTVNLDTTWAQLPGSTQNRLKAVATDMRLDTSAVTGSTTMRQLLKGIGDQITARKGAVKLGGIQISSLPWWQRAYEYAWTTAVAWAVTITDNFTGGNVSPLPAPWSHFSAGGGFGDLQRVGNRARGISGTSGASCYTGFLPTGNISAQITASTMSAANSSASVMLMCDPGTSQSYFFSCRPDGISIIWLLDPDFNTIAFDPGLGCVAGNTVKGTIAPNGDVELFVNGTSQLTGNDTTLTSGYAGIEMEWATFVAETEVDDFIVIDDSVAAGTARRRGSSGWR